jgi:fluoroacetyl-CoA thioesterase
MKSLFRPGDCKTYRKRVGAEDVAAFHGEIVHEVCSTFSLARDFEWVSRLFFIEMKDEDEEGVGTHLSIGHKSPAFVGEEVIFTAIVEEIDGDYLTCRVEAKAGERLIADGKTVQKMLKKTRLNKLFSRGDR